MMGILKYTRTSKQLHAITRTMSKTFSSAQHATTSTVDESEIKMFKDQSASWWENANIKPLHSMNQLRVPFIRDGLINTGIVPPNCVNTPEPLKGVNILEVGCGGGILAEPLARLGAKTVGLDASIELINVAKNHAEGDATLSNNLTYVNTTIENYATSNKEKYDAIVSSEVIEHITEKKLFVDACTQCLKPGGSIFFTTFNRTNLAWFVGIILAEYVVQAVPKGTHQWEKFIAPHQLQRLLEDYNCHTTVIHGMWYNYFTNTWSWTSDKSVSYALQAVKT